MLGWAQCGFRKKCIEIRYTKLVLLHLVGSAGLVVHSSASRPQKVDALFFMIGWARCGFHKKCVRTRYAEIVLLHPVASTHHVAHSGASRRQMLMHYFSCSGGTGTDSTNSAPGHVTPNLCFCIRWDLQVT
jgi:hypothetical protein